MKSRPVIAARLANSVSSANSARRANASARARGFTLVEILIVVIILGILAAIVIPQFTNASTDARKSSMASELQTFRSQFELYKLQHNDLVPPSFQNSAPTWAELTAATDINGSTSPASGATTYGPYFQTPPVNPLTQSTSISTGSPDTTTGWLYNPTTGVIDGVNAAGAPSDTGD